MTVFGAYSRYYDLFYRDKDYAGEADYVHGLIRRFHPAAASLLDLGCGTGRHARLLAEKGYRVAGVDRSAEMLAVAGQAAPAGVTFHHGDLRTVRLGETFDVVVSLFHVISYQTGNQDLRAAFATVREHLVPGGLFIFDCWYGPAVLTDRPVVRVKRLEDGTTAVTRVVEPVLHPNDNLVDLHYQVLVRDKAAGTVDELSEIHQIRYLFRPELELLLNAAGLSLVAETEWLSGRPLGWDTWGACFVARRTESP